MLDLKTRPAAIRYMEALIENTVSIIVGIMVVNIAVGVFFRYVLQNSLFWTEELGRYLMVWAGYLGAVLATKEDGHVGISAFVDAFPPAGQKALRFTSRLITFLFLVVIVFTSFRHLKTLNIQKSSALEIPMALPYLSVTVGSFLMAIENLVRLLGYPAETDAPDEAK